MSFKAAVLKVEEDPGQEMIVCGNEREYIAVRDSLKRDGRDDVVVRSFGMSTTGLRVRRVTVSASIHARLPDRFNEVDFQQWFDEHVRPRLAKNAEVVMVR